MLVQNLSKFTHVVRRDGWGVAVRKAVSYGLRGTPPAVQEVVQGKRDVIGHYDFLLGEEQGHGLQHTIQNIPRGSMTWVVPDFTANSGGHINIFRMIRLLKERGYPKQHVVIMEPHRWSSVEEAQASFNKAFGGHGITLSLGVRSIAPCEYLFATGWQTAYWVAKYRDAIHKLYFVQDFEPSFYAQGSEYVLAENTYKLGLIGITAGTWLAKKLKDEYGMRTFPFSFACDVDLYKPYPRRRQGRRHIFFYARPVTPRRCFEIGLMALNRVCNKHEDVAVIFAGWDVGNYKIPFHHLNGGTVAIEELPDLYSQCDVALILSGTNLSLLPLEVAACGCPLVLNNGPHSNWLLSTDEATYCEMSVEGITAALDSILRDPITASSRAKNALDKARKSSWEHEADEVARFLRALEVST